MKRHIIITTFIISLLINACSKKTGEEYSEDFISQVDSIHNLINEKCKTSELDKNPLQFFAINSYNHMNRIVIHMEAEGFDEKKLYSEIQDYKAKLIDNSPNDSLISNFNDLLCYSYEDFNLKEIDRIRKNVLVAQYLFLNDMYTTIVKLENKEDITPYLIPIKSDITDNQQMEAFIIVPDPRMTKLIFHSPDSIEYDDRREIFIYVSAHTNKAIDSIKVEAQIQNSKTNQIEQINLTSVYSIDIN